MVLRAVLSAAFIATTAIGLASPANAESECPPGFYQDSSGVCVHDPEQAPSAPPGATALCRDGSYSFSQHHSGTCSGHHGVQEWLS